MPPREFDFTDQLVMSQGHAASADIQEILCSMLPGAVSATPAATANDRQGVDWWVELTSARHLAVDVKVRQQDWAPHGKDDLALEIWSVVPSVSKQRGAIGWTRDSGKKCDYVLWYWQDSQRFCLLPFLPLCHVFTRRWEEWQSRYQTARQHTVSGTSGYLSECVFVPRRVVWREIYESYGGQHTVHRIAAA
jgi:hypothetical protein